MISRLNASSEVSLFPTGLGNHYISSNKHLIPPARTSFSYNQAASSSASVCDDPNAPEANISFREDREYFGPDVLVIIGLTLSCVGAVLTLVSFYYEFKHPAILATMAGIGPSLVGIGMLFCILRIFFCTFCISRTCCECIGDGLRFLVARCPCLPGRPKKKVHPLHVKDIKAKPVVNGQAAVRTLNSMVEKRKSSSEHVLMNGDNNNTISQSLEMTALRIYPIHEVEERQTLTAGVTDADLTPEKPPQLRGKLEEDILGDEIDLLDEISSGKSSPRSSSSLHMDINELVMKNSRRY